ncbi:ABC transporter substrate-binding protein [uncultured Roseibium sp.]|uniref:ABC transporter substrate-binding protein n=1 Tax=uncultured Roseibium sp. TaxID=1936171 RepID=UPI00262AEDBA|nr:ABC transporter substrate-binding protein [uncultured Roseibium sp.]
MSFSKLLRAAAVVSVMLTTASAALAKDELVVDLVNEPATLDPHMQWNPDSYYVYRNIFDNLVTRNNDGEIVPQVAESWEQISDTELQLDIRDGITFHDGEPLTADDVVYSVKRITDPDFSSPQLGQFNSIVDAKKVDDNTVVLTTKEPYPALLAQLVKLSIVPEHVAGKLGKEGFNEAPVGSGPYKFDGWDRGVQVTLSKNDNYWGDKGPFETVVFKAVPDASTRVANLRAGTADLVVSLNSDLAMQFEGADGVKVLSAPTERVGFMGMNTLVPPLDDPEIRLAAAMAIDREGIVEGILQGGESVASQMATSAHFGFVEGVEPVPYDLEKARAIVEEKGEAAKVPMKFATSPVYDQRIVQAIQQMLNEAGFDVEISMTDMATYLKAAQNPEQSARPQLSFGRWSCACQDVDGVQYPLLHSSSNWSRVNDPALDTLLETGRATLDEAARLDAYSKVQKIVADNTYILPLYQAAALYGANDALVWQPTANESLFLNRMSWQN